MVTAAIQLAQESDLDALSMRAGPRARSGVGVMSLSTEVPGRAELIELMIDRAYGSFELPTQDRSTR
ncbi:hypothetical protein [Nakamurella leprariae]|uniref:Uncharacterized protein n=1 Tax=Nakamurella leprariae TaxID=2803911 RepID=A0A939BXH9_9ACTN|nr:hypothetical protein [Nakamurella leprariae]MBM9466000.1 hypothetical protein [Nakamurella leprariae]